MQASICFPKRIQMRPISEPPPPSEGQRAGIAAALDAGLSLACYKKPAPPSITRFCRRGGVFRRSPLGEHASPTARCLWRLLTANRR